MVQPIKSSRLTRRDALLQAGCGLGAAFLAGVTARGNEPTTARPELFRYCLNTATLGVNKRPLPETIAIAAKAGYSAIEPWISEIQQFVEKGGKLPDLKKQLADAGLSVESAIGFSDWISDSAEQTPNGLDAWKRDFDMMAQIGGRRICAPPSGAVKVEEKDLLKIATRYRRLLELGRTFGVTPQLELWAFSKTLHRLGEIAYVIAETNDVDACALLDAYHIYAGGSPMRGVRAFNGRMLHVFHMNDYPSKPAHGQKPSEFRVYPGDGILPLEELLRDLRDIGFCGFLSLEIFNSEYYGQDPLSVARTGLEKMKALAMKIAS